MLAADSLAIPNGSQINIFIPLEQDLLVFFEGCELPRCQLNPNQGAKVLYQFIHFDIICMPDFRI